MFQALNLDGKRKLAAEAQKRAYDEQIERNKLHLVEKNRFRNLERSMHYQRRERETADRLFESKQREAHTEQKIDKTKALARELDKIKRSELRDLKLRLYKIVKNRNVKIYASGKVCVKRRTNCGN